MNKTIKIKDIMLSPPTNSGLKRIHVFSEPQNLDDIPVYSASKDEKAIFGWDTKESKWRKYSNVLTWNKDGSSGMVFYRKNMFIPYEKVKILEIKEQYKNYLDYTFLKRIIQKKLISFGYSFGTKCSMHNVLETEIEVPISADGSFNIKKQQEIALKYEKTEIIREQIRNIKEDLQSYSVNFDNQFKSKDTKLSDIFEIKKGNSKYTKAYIKGNEGNFPVYSSQTTNSGEIGRINSYDLHTSCITRTTDGIHAGTVFLRKNCKFSMTTHCGALIPQDNIDVDISFIYSVLRVILKDYAIGEGNKRLTTGTIKDVVLSIPIKDNGEFDLKKQQEIALKYEKLEQIKQKLITQLEELQSYEVEI